MKRRTPNLALQLIVPSARQVASSLKRAHEVVRREIESEPFVEPTSVDTANMADELHRLGATACRRFKGGTDELFADATSPVCLVDHQGVDGDEVARPLELSPGADRDETDHVAVRLDDDDLSRW